VKEENKGEFHKPCCLKMVLSSFDPHQARDSQGKTVKSQSDD